MASTHIEIPSTASRLSADFRSAIDRARTLQNDVIKIKDIADTVASGGDWAALATYLGTDATDAETAYNLLTSIQDEFTSADYNAFIDRLG